MGRGLSIGSVHFALLIKGELYVLELRGDVRTEALGRFFRSGPGTRAVSFMGYMLHVVGPAAERIGWGDVDWSAASERVTGTQVVR
jgi:hypothetical protein